MSGPDYKGEFHRLMAESVADVLPALARQEPWLMKKIANAADRYSLSEDTIIAAVRNCEVVRCYIAKEPGKQGMHENLAAAFIKDIPGVDDFNQLRGGMTIHVVAGKLVTKSALDTMRKSNSRLIYSKSVDFGWNFQSKRFLAYHKYTEENGGAQGNQGNDVKTFMRQAAKNDDPDSVFIALCDGAYYMGANGKLGRSKLESIQKIGARARHRNVFAMKTGELPAFLRLKFASTNPR